MAFFKVGLLSTVFVVTIIISTRAEEDGTSQTIEKSWHSRRAYPIGESIEAGRNPISGSNMPYKWQNSEGKTNMPLDTYEHNPQSNNNNDNEHTENVLKWNGPTLIEHTLRRDPLTGKLYVFKVTKYRRDNNGQNGWVELWNGMNSYNMYETDKAKQSKPDMTLSGYTSGEHKQIEKQPNNDIYKYHSRSYQYEDVTRNQEPTETGDNTHSVLLNRLLKRPVPATDSPLAGIFPYSENKIQNENNKYKENQLVDRSEEPLDTSIYHRRATICVVNGDPEKCRKVMQMAMYLKTILDSRRALKHSHIEEKIKSMQKNLNNMWKNGEPVENWYFKMLSQFIGKDIGMPENNSTHGSLEQRIILEVLNLWNKIFGEASDNIRNNEVSSEGKDTAEELTQIWKNLLNNVFNTSATKEDIPAQMNVTENTDHFISNLPPSLLTIVRYILNDIFSNKTIKEDGTSMTQDDYLLQDIVYLWKVLMNTINVSNILFPHFEQILLQTKNTSEYFLSTLLKQLDLWDENIALIKSLKKIWDSIWHEIFSYISELQSGTGHVQSEQGKEDLNAHQWEKLIWNILSKNIYGSEEKDNLNKYPENVNVESVTETTAAITKNTQNISDTGNNINSSHTYYGNPEIHKNNTKIEVDYSWEDLLREIATKLGEINGTFLNHRTDIPDTTIAPEDHVQDTNGKTNDDILKMISHKFESAENVQYGSIKDNYWEEMMHEILNTENEIRNNDAKDKDNDIWWHLKNHFNMTTNKDNNESKNYIWQYFVNGMLGSDPEVDSDMYFGHMSAMEYIKQWVENYTNPIFGQDEIWNQLFNDTETEITTSENYNSTHAVTAPEFETFTSQEIFNGTSSEPSLKDTIEPESIPVELQSEIGLHTGTSNLTVNK